MAESSPMAKPQLSEETNKSVDFHFIKSNYFRVVHADGVYGGTTPHGNIHLTFYNERPTIPRHNRLELSSDGIASGKETVVETRGGIVRETEVDVVMSFTSLASFYFWLAPKMEDLRKNIGMKEEEWEKMKTELSAANKISE